MTRVGFIGLGSQGGGMAQRLVQCGLPTTLWARRAESLDPYRSTAASFADSPAALAAVSDVVGVCVVDDAGVEDVVLGDEGVLTGMAPGGVIALHSTISLEMCRKVAEYAATRGVRVIDAPVSGGGLAAAEGELTVMVGGAADDVERARPALETYGNPVLHLGPLGSGLLAKLVNNTLRSAHYALAEQALTAGTSLGLDREALGRTLAASSGSSAALVALVRRGSLDLIAQTSGPLMRKDVGIFADLLADASIDPGNLVEAADAYLRLAGNPRSASDPRTD